jgi:hypothetical protein
MGTSDWMELSVSVVLPKAMTVVVAEEGVLGEDAGETETTTVTVAGWTVAVAVTTRVEVTVDR